MSLYPNNSTNNSNFEFSVPSSYFSARVKDILLDNSQPLFKKLSGWADVGTIQFKPLFKTSESNSISSALYAKPLFSNLKQYPLKEEIVLILSAPSSDLNFNPNSTDYYYFPLPIGIWNSNHHNSFPDISKFENNPEDLNFGETFTENENIKNLKHDEGDFILEGRFGNSIRFSSTIIKKDLYQNPWSESGNNGDPIIIIRNGQTISSESSPWTPIYEDINGDDSSIYLTSGQEIPLELSCKNLQTFDITLSNSLNMSLQLPDANSF